MSWGNRNKFFSEPRVCERGKWSEDKICRLVCLYKKFPCLWKKDNSSYMNNSARHSAYSNIHQGMDTFQMTFTEVMIKIREVRRTYVNELQKVLKARSSGREYEPRQRWFFALHNFLYEYLDFDETAELRSPEDSASSCRRDEDDEEFDDANDSEDLDSDTPPQSDYDYNPSSSFESSKTGRCGKNSQRIPCGSSAAGSSTMNYLPPQKNPQCSSSLRTDSYAPKVKRCPIKLVHSPERESKGSSEVCYMSPRSGKSTSITIVCGKKTDCPNPRDEKERDVQWKRSSSIEKVACTYRGESNALSCPKTSSIERFDSNGSLNASLGKTQDEFDVFAKSVACQLRKMDVESAVMAQNQIQNLLTDQRLHGIQPIRPEPSQIKNIVEVQDLPSPRQSVTQMRSRVIKPTRSTSKRHSFTMKPTSQNIRKNEVRIVKAPARATIGKRMSMSNQTSQRKTKKGLPK